MTDAHQVWREKLNHLLVEQATAVDPEQKFNIKQKIKEAKAALAELENESGGEAPLEKGGSPDPSATPEPKTPLRDRNMGTGTPAPKRLRYSLSGSPTAPACSDF